MSKSLLKTLVATAAVGLTMALTSVAAMAATYEYIPSGSETFGKGTSVALDKDGFFTANDTNGKFAADSNKKTSPVDKKAFTNRFKSGGKNGDITFELKESGALLVDAMSGSSGKSRTLTISQDGNTVATLTNTGQALGSLYVPDLAAGSYKITFSDGINIYRLKATTGTDVETLTIASTESSKNSDKIYVDPINGDTYIVHSITEADLAGIDSLTLVTAAGTKLDDTTTSTVYTSVSFTDGSSVTAADGQYIYAVKLEGTGARVPYADYSWATE